MTIGSLFSGIGGLDLGLERAGHTIQWHVEDDPFCQDILARHWPHVPCYGDITTVTGHDLAPVDLLCGGFPCQPVSQAGHQKGPDDERWLWPDFARLLRVLRPRYALLENVPGLLTANGGRAFGEVLGDLAEIGFDAQYDTLSAAQFGAKHLRYRVFLFAYLVSNAKGAGRTRGAIADRRCATLADADAQRLEGERADSDTERWERSAAGSPGLRGRANRFFDAPIRGDWTAQSSVCRVASGVPHRVERLKSLGNAVVPQIAEWLGHRLTQWEATP